MKSAIHSRPWIIYTVCVAVAFCSILYELLLAQTLATTMGNTKLRYNITIGLYIASMGVGALLFERILTFFRLKKDKAHFFIYLELLLSFIGLMSPVLVLFMDWLVRELCSSYGISYLGFFPQTSIFLFNHSLIIIIGLLSGLELPLLMEIAQESNRGTEAKTLAFDYLGTLIGAVCFPILFLPYIPLFSMALFVGLFNALSALVFSIVLKDIPRVAWVLNVFLLLLVSGLLLLGQDYENFIINNFYFSGLGDS